MNESLRHALLRARLSEEDVAARLEVDPKTVRRWLEGRQPYPRHRLVLATMLGLDEADLWPHLASRSLPEEILAIYPRCDDVPREMWVRLFSDARGRIDILTGSALWLAADTDVWAILIDRASAGVKERICLRDPDLATVGPEAPHRRALGNLELILEKIKPLRQNEGVEVRVHSKQHNNSIYRVDDECFVAPATYGIPAWRTPVIRMRSTGRGELFEAYLKSFLEIWASAYLP